VTRDLNRSLLGMLSALIAAGGLSGCFTFDLDLSNCTRKYLDSDRDGWGETEDTTTSCILLFGTWVERGGDCDDRDTAVHPGAEEVCNGRDDDCDGDLPSSETRDSDSDGDVLCEDCDDQASYLNSEDWDGDGLSSCDGDCDDYDEDVHPGAVPTCDGAADVDSDCDGEQDVGWVDGDEDGLAPCEGDCDDEDASVHALAEETCNGVDDDCDPATDELADVDGDGFTTCEGDCDDSEPTAWPGAVEVCDGVDNNCVDGLADAVPDPTLVKVPGHCPTIQSAIDTVEPGGTVRVESGEYIGTIDFGGKELVLQGSQGGPTILDGGGAGPVLVFDDFEGPGTVVEDFTITGGAADDGGCIQLLSSSPTLRGLLVTGCEADWGGGLYAWSSSAYIEDCRFEANTATEGGGGIHAVGHGTLQLSRVRVVDNVVFGADEPLGGGLSAAGTGDVIISNALFAGNLVAGSTISAEGGGFYLSRDAVLEHVAVVGNEVASSGARDAAGIRIEGSADVLMMDSVVAFNEGSLTTGGVDVSALATLIDEHSVFWSNAPEDLEAGHVLGAGSLLLAPMFLDETDEVASGWDLHPAVDSPLVDAGRPGFVELDGSPRDIGPYGGPGGSQWDLDGDGDPSWWQPGPYDATVYPSDGWDCDDLDGGVWAALGCGS